jgi:serine-type D-Ala-D-Ala carboxypeptidase (penicillin-binding protein 5/6)
VSYFGDNLVRRFKLLLALTLLPLMPQLLLAENDAKKQPAPKGSEPPCRAELVMEPLSGDILFERNSKEPLAPASMVKLMVAYVALKQAKEGQCNLSDVITVSPFSSKIGGSQVYLKEGEQFTLEQLLEAVLIQSANDAAVAIAEHIGGSSEGFVELMNAEAQRLGLTNTKFFSPHGLPPGKGQQPDEMSALDLATLGRALIRDFPDVLAYTGKSEAGFRNGEFIMRNHNHLVRTYQGCDGLKTGFYGNAGFGVTATAARKGVRVIAVLMGCDKRNKRDEEASRLLTLGLSSYKGIKLATKGDLAPEGVRITKGEKSYITPVFATDVTGFMKVGEEKNVIKKASLCSGLVAPVAASTPCGHVFFYLGEREVARADLVIPEAIPEGGVIKKLKQMISG